MIRDFVGRGSELDATCEVFEGVLPGVAFFFTDGNDEWDFHFIRLADLVADLDQVRLGTAASHDGQGDLFGRDLGAHVVDRSQRLAVQLSDALTLRYFSHIYDVARATV